MLNYEYGGTMIKHIKSRVTGGYTLAEIVVVMLIIAVVVGVSIKITKAKLDSVISYTYYGAYSTLRSSVSEILADYDPTKDAYTYQRRFYDMFNLTPEAYAYREEHVMDTFDTIDCSIRTNIPDSIFTASIYPSLNTDLTLTLNTETPLTQVTQTQPQNPDEPSGGGEEPGGGEPSGGENGACAGKIVACSSDKYYNYDKCACVPKKSTVPKTGEKFCTLLEEYVNIAGGTSTCNGSSIAANTTDFSDKTPDLTLRNGLRIYGLKGDYAAIPMLAGNNIAYNTDLSIADRIAILFKKLKRDVVAFFKDFNSFTPEAYAYNEQHVIDTIDTVDCSVRTVLPSLNTQLTLQPSVLTNSGCSVLQQYQCEQQGGYLNAACQCMANVNTNPTQTPTTPTSTASTGGEPVSPQDPDPLEGININEVGYIVYVDVDGSKGNSALWDDVYPFYITLSGRVVPAFDSNANPDGAGGDSIQHLQVSVKNETINAQGRRSLRWLAKSVSFREGACLAGYVSSNTPYCQGMDYNNSCSGSNSNCQVKPIKPVKFF